MKLAFVVYSLGGGGAERVIASLANHWAAKGWQITVITLASEDHDFYELHPAVGRIALNMAVASGNSLAAVSRNFARLRALRATLKEIQPDVAVAMMATANVLLALAAQRIRGTATVGSERVYPPSVSLGFVWEKLRAWSYGHLGALVVQTEKSSDWLHQHTQTRRISVIPNPVSWPLPIWEPHLPLAERRSGRNLILAVGRLNKQKGFDDLIAAFGQLADDCPSWDLVIVGEGPERSRLMNQVMREGLTSRIDLPGRSGNVGDWYAAADLYVMSSRFEGFPNTLVEAMAYGLPVVSFDCDTGPRDIIQNEINGILVANADVAALGSALCRLMNDSQLRERIGTKATEVRERFSMNSVANMWEDLFQELGGRA